MTVAFYCCAIFSTLIVNIVRKYKAKKKVIDRNDEVVKLEEYYPEEAVGANIRFHEKNIREVAHLPNYGFTE